MHNLTQHWLMQHWPLRAGRITDHAMFMDGNPNAGIVKTLRLTLRQRRSGTGCALPATAA